MFLAILNQQGQIFRNLCKGSVNIWRFYCRKFGVETFVKKTQKFWYFWSRCQCSQYFAESGEGNGTTQNMMMVEYRRETPAPVLPSHQIKEILANMEYLVVTSPFVYAFLYVQCIY